MNQQQRLCLGIYLALLLMCTTLFFLSSSLPLDARDQLVKLAGDGFKLLLGAIVGALSAILGVASNSPSNAEKDQNHE